MSEPDDLDPGLRDKLRAAAAQIPVRERPERDALLVQALLREQAAPAPRRWTHAALVATGALAAAAALFLLLRPAPAARVASAPVLTPACALPRLAAPELDADGKQRLSLGGFGTLVAAPGSRLEIEASEACRLTLRLTRGELAGDLQKLKPAELHVRTPYATVVVRGTRFSVRADDELEVVLLSGRVDVEDSDHRVLEPQRVLRKRGAAWEQRASGAGDAARVEALLTGTPAQRGAAPAASVETVPEQAARAAASSSELLARAESARQRGLVPRARSYYAQAAERRDADGEVALLRWVRLELAARAFPEAARLLAQHRQQYPAGKLRAEGAWLEVVLLRDQGDDAPAQAAARAFLTHYPTAPQAEAARALSQGPARGP